MPTVGRTRWPALLLCVALALLLLTPSARAVDLPPAGAKNFIQTSGPQTLLNIGDYYTSQQGGKLPDHEFIAYVSCTWPTNLPITFAIFDPEVAVPDPASSDPIPADDEIRNAQNQEVDTNNVASDSTFTLTAPGGASITKTYTPNGGTNRRWVELLTVQPGSAGYGCGQYSLRASTGGNDDNAYVLRIANDPDCTVTPGTCSTVSDQTSALMGNANFTDNPDGKAGSGDELAIGMERTSFQQYPGNDTALACQRFYTFAPPNIGTVTFNNFDLDLGVQGDKQVNYYPPANAANPAKITGTVSGNAVWNNPPTPGTDANGVPLRGGDKIAIDASNAGWWTIEVCTQPANPQNNSAKNQYIVESSAGVLFLDLPPQPRMTLSKTDGLDVAQRGQTLNYVVTFANTSDQTSTPGAAANVQLTDTIPVGTTYQSCAIDAPYTGTCSFANGVVTYKLNELVAAGAGGTVRVAVTVNNDAPEQLENVAVVNYTDTQGNNYPPARATDLDRVPAPGPNAVTLTSFTATRGAGTIELAWRTAAEIDSTGFYVLRGVGADPSSAKAISPLIRAEGANGGASYDWTDNDPVSDASYWLEEVDIHGHTTRYGPVKVSSTISANYTILVPLAWR